MYSCIFHRFLYSTIQIHFFGGKEILKKRKQFFSNLRYNIKHHFCVFDLKSNFWRRMFHKAQSFLLWHLSLWTLISAIFRLSDSFYGRTNNTQRRKFHFKLNNSKFACECKLFFFLRFLIFENGSFSKFESQFILYPI